ncbi:VWA domain-containing protein [Rhodococcus opacus]|uniref:VWA domain-containing protein n=1 Tax=Rhodococcus opacus TaxID=37919 RepID=UPI0026D6FCF0|nr:VWA domain-containing protein [Rhodococcus opacus]MDV7088616.1 VWA domain-containing protein [Rhodococcus opacus]
MTSLRMIKGSNTTLNDTLVYLRLSWSFQQGAPDVDVSALLLTVDGKVRGDDDFVFYNQPNHASGAVTLAGKRQDGGRATDTMMVDVSRVEPDVERIVLAASSDGGTFGHVTDLLLELMDRAGHVIAHFPVADASNETAMLCGEIYRRAGAWKFRAVGQGYASGLLGLATDFGITVDETPASALPPAPSLAPPVEPTQVGARLPIDMQKRLDLRKRQVAVSLAKRGASTIRARVILVLDASGSMSRLYQKGVVGRVVERMAAVAAQLDDDGEMQAFTFASNSARLPDLRIDELPEWTSLHVRVGQTRLLGRAPKGQTGQVDMRTIGIQNEEQKVIGQVRAYVRSAPVPSPTLVLFFSDGGVYRNNEIEKELREAVGEPIFWQFVGLGSAKFGVLERFDTMKGRRVDNTGFFAVRDIDKLPDADLYDSLLSEFPSWINDARRAGILRQ